MASREDDVRERLTAYIHPRAPSTPAQQEAFEKAVAAQVVFEDENPQGAVKKAPTKHQRIRRSNEQRILFCGIIDLR